MSRLRRPSSVRVACVLALAVALAGCRGGTPAPVPLPDRVEATYRALDAGFDQTGAFDVVVFMDRYWRLAANPGFDATVDHLREGLEQGGFAAGRPEPGAAPAARAWVEEYPDAGHGGDYEKGRVRLVGADGAREVVLSREQDRVSLCINSFSTPPDGLTAPLVDVGVGTSDADYAGKTVKGAVVLGDGPVGQLWRQAVQQRGAAGVISTAAPGYIRPDSPDAFTHRDQWDVFQWGSIPYDDTARSFAFKASMRAAKRLRDALAAGPATVEVEVASTFHDGPAGRWWPNPGSLQARRAHRHGRAHPGARRERRRERVRDALRAGARARRGYRQRAYSAARAHAHVPVGRRDPRQPAVADRPPGGGEGGAVHALARHDGRGRDEDRWHVPDREAARPLGLGRGRPTRTPSGARAR